MNAVYTTERVRRGEFLFTWGGVHTVYENLWDDLHNLFDVERYAISFEDERGRTIMCCPRLGASSGTPETEDKRTMSSFLNEPSPWHTAHLLDKDSDVVEIRSHEGRRRRGRPPLRSNVATFVHTQGATACAWGIIVLASRDIAAGEELTLVYSEENDTYDRSGFEFYDEDDRGRSRRLRVHPQYAIGRDSKQLLMEMETVLPPKWHPPLIFSGEPPRPTKYARSMFVRTGCTKKEFRVAQRRSQLYRRYIARLDTAADAT